MKKNLTQAILEYKQSGKGLKEVVDAVALSIYFYPPMRKQWTEDRCGDFLCYFYPRILRMINRFEDRGKPFEALLAVALKWQMRDFGQRMHQKERKEKMLVHPVIWDYIEENISREGFPTIDLSEPPIEISKKLKKALRIDASGVVLDPGIRRRIFCLLLKEVHQVTDSLLVHAALLTGCEQTWLEEKLRQARELTFQREGRRETFQHRRCQALFNLYSLHDRIRESINPAERADLFRQLEKETRRLNRAKEALRRVSRRPSHREIASLLGLPKGTVDSGLYYLNQSLSFAAEESPIMRSPGAGLEPRR